MHVPRLRMVVVVIRGEFDQVVAIHQTRAVRPEAAIRHRLTDGGSFGEADRRNGIDYGSRAVYGVHCVDDEAIPEKAAIFVFVQQLFGNGSSNAIGRALGFRDVLWVHRKNRNIDSIWTAQIAVQIVIFYKTIAKEKSAIVSTTVGVHHLVACTEISQCSNDEGILFIVIFP